MVTKYLDCVQIFFVDCLEKWTKISVIHIDVKYFGPLAHKEFTEVVIAIINGLA